MMIRRGVFFSFSQAVRLPPAACLEVPKLFSAREISSPEVNQLPLRPNPGSLSRRDWRLSTSKRNSSDSIHRASKSATNSTPLPRDARQKSEAQLLVCSIRSIRFQGFESCRIHPDRREHLNFGNAQYPIPKIPSAGARQQRMMVYVTSCHTQAKARNKEQESSWIR